MNTQQFVNRLEDLINQKDFGALVHFAMKGPDGIVLKRANILDSVLASIAEDYKNSIAGELDRFIHDDQMSVLNLSDRDERVNVIYRYDIPDEEPSYFAAMKEPITKPAINYSGDKLFNFEKDSFSNISYFVIALGTAANHIVVYRDNFNVNLMKQGAGKVFLSKSGTQITRVNEDILRMDSQIDCMLIDDDYYIVNLKNLDTRREFASIIRKRAEKSLDEIAKLPFVDNVEGLREHLEDLSFARRLMRAMDNTPVTLIPADDVLSFVRNHQSLSCVLHIEGDKFKLDSKRAQSAFVSLLNDDFLYSKLTQRDYESSAKDQMR